MDGMNSNKMIRKFRNGALLSLGVALSGCTWDHAQPEVCFEAEVLPIFVNYCSTSGCHSDDSRSGDYALTSYEGIMKGITPGKPNNSDIYEAITKDPSEDDHMPLAGSPQLNAEQIDLIEAWISEGALETRNCGIAGCDTSAVVSFSADISPMLTTYCRGCHGSTSPSGGLNFNDFATVQQTAQIGSLQGALSHDPDFTAMPPGSAPLSACYVAKIDKWVAAGAPNN